MSCMVSIAPGGVIDDPDILMLYNAGNECVKVTGGWEVATNPIYWAELSGSDYPFTGTTTKYNDHLYMFAGAHISAGFVTTNMIDFSGYSYVNLEFTDTGTYSGCFIQTYSASRGHDFRSMSLQYPPSSKCQITSSNCYNPGYLLIRVDNNRGVNLTKVSLSKD